MSAKVLLVEDDKDIRRNVQRLLTMEGYRVEVAGNGREALLVLQTAQELPSLIVLDLMMPVMDGFQFREQQAKDARLADIPVVIMTADGHVEEKLKRAGAAAALKKPADIEAILDMVSRFSKKP